VALQKTKKNEILVEVRAAGFDPTEFQWSVSTMHRGSQEILLHGATDSYFDFIFDSSSWRAVWKPDEEAPVDGGNFGAWNNLMVAARRWLNALRAEVDAPDLWAELERERDALLRPTLIEAANTPFSGEERVLISAQIRELKEYVAAAYELSADQQRELEARLDYVESASRRMGRFDWWNLFAGALINLVLAAIVPPHAVQAILLMAAHGLAQLFGGAPPALPQ
jgi:hypothetical protein